jgi:hypothetical protein
LLKAAGSQTHCAPRTDLSHWTTTTSVQVCELLAKNAWQQVADMKRAATPADPVSFLHLPAGSGGAIAGVVLATICSGRKACSGCRLPLRLLLLAAGG